MAALATDPTIANDAALAQALHNAEQPIATEVASQIEADATLAAALANIGEDLATIQIGLPAIPAEASAASASEIAKLRVELQQLETLARQIETVGLSELNVHSLSQAGVIKAAYLYAKLLDAAYGLAKQDLTLIQVLEFITKEQQEICTKLAQDTARAEQNGRPANIIQGFRTDANILATNVPRVLNSIQGSIGIDPETQISLQELISKAWSLASHQLLQPYNYRENLVRNLSLNVETGGGCIPGIIVRLMVPYTCMVLLLMQNMLLGNIPIPHSNNPAPIVPPAVSATPAYAQHANPTLQAKAASVTATAASDPAFASPADIAAAVASRRELLTLYQAMGRFKNNIEEVIIRHTNEIQNYSLAKILDLKSQDDKKITAAKKDQQAAKPS